MFSPESVFSAITVESIPFKAFGGTAETALQKCLWISVILVLTGKQHASMTITNNKLKAEIRCILVSVGLVSE